MRILGIDPGPNDSAGVIYDVEKQKIIEHWHRLNDEVLGYCMVWFKFENDGESTLMVAIEDPQAQRRPASEDFINTCKWSARFYQALLQNNSGNVDRVKLIPYREVSAHFCKVVNAKEKFIKEELIKRYGDPGTKKNPGILYGITGHKMSALAVAVTLADRYEK